MVRLSAHGCFRETTLTFAVWSCSDDKYESLEKSSKERYKDLEKKSAAELSKAEKEAADKEKQLKNEAAAAAVMADEKYNSLASDKKSAEQGAPCHHTAFSVP